MKKIRLSKQIIEALFKECLMMLFLLIPMISVAQTSAKDSLQVRVNAIRVHEVKLDSLPNVSLKQVDSIRNYNIDKADSIQASLSNKLDASSSTLNSKIDSLGSLNLSPDIYSQKLDSLYKDFQSGTVDKLKSEYASVGMIPGEKLSKLESLVQKRSNALDSLITLRKGKPLSLEDKVELEKLNGKIPYSPDAPGVNIPSTGLNTELNLSAVNIPTDGIAIPDAGMNIDKPKMPEVKGIEKISEAKEMAAKGEEYVGDVANAKEEIKKVKEGEYNEELKKEATEEAKKQTQNIDQVKELSAQTKAAEEAKAKMKALGDVTGKKEELKVKSTKTVKDHFAGKDQIINKDMQEIGKLQMKYRNVADSRNLPKRVPNEMKGKPFVERLIPAVSFQIFNAGDVSVDFAPSIGYRFSGKLRAGVGAYRRVTYLKKEKDIKVEDLTGVRLYGSYKLIRSFSLYSEVEKVKNNLVPTLHTNWSTKFNFGMYNTYKLTNHINGHIILVYDLAQLKEFPQSKHSSLRFGFDYQFKVKKK